MLPSLRVGALFGIPIRIHLSFALLLGAILLWTGGLAGLLVTLMIAASILVHELGHAPARLRWLGLPRRPGDEIAIAAAGPAVSFALAGLGHGLAAVTGLGVLALLGWVNLVLAAFNLLPAFPSDGGRILRAWLARKRGLVRATELAVSVGRVVCLAMGVTGLAIGSFQLVLVAVVLWMAGGAERLSARLRGDHGAWRSEGAPTQVSVEYIPRPSTRDDRPSPSGRPVTFVWRR